MLGVVGVRGVAAVGERVVVPSRYATEHRECDGRRSLFVDEGRDRLGVSKMIGTEGRGEKIFDEEDGSSSTETR